MNFFWEKAVFILIHYIYNVWKQKEAQTDSKKSFSFFSFFSPFKKQYRKKDEKIKNSKPIDNYRKLFYNKQQ